MADTEHGAGWAWGVVLLALGTVVLTGVAALLVGDAVAQAGRGWMVVVEPAFWIGAPLTAFAVLVVPVLLALLLVIGPRGPHAAAESDEGGSARQAALLERQIVHLTQQQIGLSERLEYHDNLRQMLAARDAVAKTFADLSEALRGVVTASEKTVAHYLENRPAFARGANPASFQAERQRLGELWRFVQFNVDKLSTSVVAINGHAATRHLWDVSTRLVASDGLVAELKERSGAAYAQNVLRRDSSIAQPSGIAHLLDRNARHGSARQFLAVMESYYPAKADGGTPDYAAERQDIDIFLNAGALALQERLAPVAIRHVKGRAEQALRFPPDEDLAVLKARPDLADVEWRGGTMMNIGAAILGDLLMSVPTAKLLAGEFPAWLESMGMNNDQALRVARVLAQEIDPRTLFPSWMFDCAFVLFDYSERLINPAFQADPTYERFGTPGRSRRAKEFMAAGGGGRSAGA